MVNKLAEMADLHDALNKAFYLASFIHGSKETALRIVTAAAAKLEVAVSAQGKRLYYRTAHRRPRRQARDGVSRTKVSFGELHLLQRLVYAESEPYEKEKERAGIVGALGQEDLLIHFIKHLVRITVKRNSFYVTLGLSRLLHDYTTSETMEIYNVVVQDPERVKDDYYYRSRKGVLMQELRERFGEFMRTSRGPHGEERFQAEPQPSRFAKLIGECLSVFTPWGTLCLVPAGHDPVTDNIPSLSPGGEEDDQIEVNRIHAVLHPDCYGRLVQAVGLSAPDERLEVPHFFLSHEHVDRQGGKSNRGQPSPLSVDEVNAIKSSLEELAERRRSASAGLLRIIIDGVERACLNLMRARRIKFDLGAGAELIEIRAFDRGGDLLLASHLLSYDEPNAVRPSRASVTLERGQKLSIIVTPSGAASGVMVEVMYSETNLARAVALFSRQVLTTLTAVWRPTSADQPSPQVRSGFKVATLAMSFLLAIICAAAILVYTRRGKPRSEQPIRANAERTEAPEGHTTPGGVVSANTTTEAGASQTQAQTARRSRAGQMAQTAPSPAPRLSNRNERNGPETGNQVSSPRSTAALQGAMPRRDPPEEETTRSTSGGAASASLLDARRIYVEVVGDEAENRGVRKGLIEELQARNRFVLSESRDEADALLKVTVRQSGVAGRRRPTFVVQLINAAGEVIYPPKGRSSRGTYQELPANELSALIVADLLGEIERLERGR